MDGERQDLARTSRSRSGKPTVIGKIKLSNTLGMWYKLPRIQLPGERFLAYENDTAQTDNTGGEEKNFQELNDTNLLVTIVVTAA